MGAAYQLSQYFWTHNGLDVNTSLDDIRNYGMLAAALAPFILALVGIFARPLAVFVLFYLVGAMLTAPFALARFAV